MPMTQEVRMGLILITPLILQMIGLTFAVLVDSYIRREHRIYMLIIIALSSSLIAQNIVESLLGMDGRMPYERTLIGIYGYSVRPMLILLFLYIVSPERRRLAEWILITINTCVHLTALFSGICFQIDENNIFHRGPLGYTCHVISGIMLFYLIYLSVREYSHVGKAEAWIPICNALLIVVAVIMDSIVDYNESPVTFLTIAVVSSNVFYYIWLHLQFVRQHEQALRAEQRIQIMMSQIQPHFLYNTLSTIQALCRIDPEKAFYTTERFGAYLRQNIDSLSQPDLIPLSKELEHTRIYTEIEMIRFPNIHIEYDIENEDFLLPALSVQPLVENAIRHGVRIRRNGLVSVMEREKDGYHEIVIRDNGRGFDAETAEVQRESMEGKHIGIQNVRERIEKMCGGMLTIDSRIDEGTTVTIHIPFRQEEN